MYRILLHPGAKKALILLPKNAQEKVRDALDGIAKNPFIGKKLKGAFDGLYAMRVWPYRIVYSVKKKIVTVTVLRIGHRQGVYD